MLFLGDVVCPDERVDAFIQCLENEHVFDNEIVVLNLEANILFEKDNRKPLTLWNSPQLFKAFTKAKQVIVSLANNHAYDYPEKILSTVSFLHENGIGVFGICNEDGSFNPFEYVDETGVSHAFFGHCWRLYTKTHPNLVNKVRIVDSLYDEFNEQVRVYKLNHPHTKVYCMMHWNYDMEFLPFPMHRKIARQLVDFGVDAVIGSHSHRPQGAEVYKGKPIAYGLGNFYLPSGVYFEGKLKYPECSHKTYGLRLRDKTIEALWFETDSQTPVKLTAIEPFEGGQGLKLITPFQNMSDLEYRSYFLNNRVKKTLVPVFDDMKGPNYLLREKWAVTRVNIIRNILKLINK